MTMIPASVSPSSFFQIQIRKQTAPKTKLLETVTLSLSLVPFVCCCFPSFTADCFSFLHLCPSWPLVSLLASFCAFHSVQDTLGMPRQPARANMSVDYDHSFVNKSRRAIEKEFDGRFVRTKRAGGLFGQSGFAHTHTQ